MCVHVGPCVCVSVCVCVHACVCGCVYPQVSNRHLVKTTDFEEADFPETKFLKKILGPGIRSFMNYDHPRVKNGLNLDLLGLKQKGEYMWKYGIYLPGFL